MKLYKKVALFVLMMILPLNLVALSVTQNAMDATISQTVATDRQFAETCVDNLSGRMDGATGVNILRKEQLRPANPQTRAARHTKPR